MSPPLEVRGLTKRYGDTTAVEDLTFAIAPGRITGFLGPNGAGKTTTLRILLGLVHASSGEALVAGSPYRKLRDPVRSVGAVLEASSYHPTRSGRNHLRVQATAAGIPLTRVDETLAEVELSRHDATDRRIRNGDEVTVHSNGTSVTLRARISEDLRAGVVRIADEHAGDLQPSVELGT